MLGRGRPNIWAYHRYAPNALSYHIYDNYSHGLWNVYVVYTSHFLFSPLYYFTSGGSMMFSFFGYLNGYYHEFHGIGNSFHVHGFETISQSL